MGLDVTSTVDGLSTTLHLHASSERAVNEKRYLKSDLCHIGVSVPQIRKIARQFAREHTDLESSQIFTLVSELWSRDVYELRKLGVNILAARVEIIGSQDIARIEAFLRRSHTWALIDDLSLNVVAPVLTRVDNAVEIRSRWANDNDFWVRRTAILALLPALRRGLNGWDEFTRYADAMLGEDEFFIIKAIGWVLREISKHSPNLVAEWVKPRVALASGVTIREAVKYIPEDQRAIINELRRP